MEKPVDKVLAKLHGVKQNGKNWLALCPAHADRNPSLSVTPSLTDDGRPMILLHCFAGCSVDAVLTALGLVKADLYEIPAKNGNGAHASKIVATYSYYDANGVLLYQVMRKEPKGFMQRRPDDQGGWVWSLSGIARVLYRLPQLLAADPGEIVHITEGEKDVERLASYGWIATTNAGGASNWRTLSDLIPLHGRHIVIHEDDDAAGRSRTQTIIQSLQAYAASIKVISYVGLNITGADVSDYLQGHSIDDLRALIEQTPLYTALTEPDPVQHEPEPLRQAEEPTEEPWELPLELAEVERPAFPLHTLPQWMQDFACANAEATQTPVDPTVMMLFAAISTCLAKKVELHAKEGWNESVNLFTITAMEPSERKTPVIQPITAPFWEYQLAEQEAKAADVARAESEKRLLESALADAEKSVSKGKDADSQNAALGDRDTALNKLAKLKEVFMPQLLADDVTAESLAELMHQNGGRIAILSDEGGLLLSIMGGRYSDKPNFDIYLYGYSGSTFIINRKGKRPVTIQRASVTLGLMVQPMVLRDLAKTPEMAGRGLLSRPLYSVPQVRRNRTIRSAGLPGSLLQRYKDNIKSLLSMPYAKSGVTGEDSAHVLVLTNEAWELYADWYDHVHEPKMQPDGEYSDMIEWAGKLHGNVLRLAALLHMADCLDRDGRWSYEIGPGEIERAIEIAEYLVPHARIALGMLRYKPEVAAAMKIWDWIKEKKITSFSKRELNRFFQSERANALTEPLLYLVERGYLRVKATKRTGRGQPPSPVYEVNPLAQ